MTIELNDPKTRKKHVSQSGKTLKTEAAVLGLVLLLPASLLALTYSSQSSAQAVWSITSLQSPPPGGASQLTFLDQQVFAFNVPNEYVPYDTNHDYWHEYNFGSIVPSNATMALCILKLAGIGPYGGSDISFCLQDPIAGETVAGSTGYSMGADTIWFDGTVFAYVAIQNGQVWACNPGNVCSVDVYVVGYVTEATDVRGFYFDFATQDYSVVSGSAATSWTDISVTSIHPITLRL